MYAHFFENDLPTILEDVPLRVRTELIFQHDGASPNIFPRKMLHTHYAMDGSKWSNNLMAGMITGF